MKIGQLVKYFIPNIIEYCIKEDSKELKNLKDMNYSKQMFGINYPFWLNINDIEDNKRYWKEPYNIEGKFIRVTNHWYLKNIQPFKNYLIKKGIATEDALSEIILKAEKTNDDKLDKKVRSKGRYKGSAIGNSQNLLIRNILSNLGDEVFSESDWKETKDFFNNCCAYCNSKESLVMEHAIPINKTMLGEHRLGNIVPSCNDCNKKKAAQSYEQFLKDEIKLKKIEAYMKLKNYKPLSDLPESEIIAELLEKAYLDTAEVSKRYIQIIELIQTKGNNYVETNTI